MGRQQSGSPNRLNQSRQRESVPPLYFTPDTLTAVLDVEIEQENLPPAYSTVADENHITEVAELAPAEPSSTKAKESYPTLQYSPVVVTEESRLAGPSREKNDRTYCPTPRYSPVFDTEESRLAAPSREKDSRIYYPTPRYSPVFNTGESRLAAPSREKTNKIYYPTPRYSVVFDDGNSAIPNSEEAESRSAGLLIKKAGASFPTPRYSTVFDDEDAESRPVELGHNAPLVTHEFHMKSGGKSSQSWAMLRLFSQATSEQKVPRLHGGQVSGFINVIPESSGVPSVHAVTLMLRGKMISGLHLDYPIQHTHHTFLDEQFMIWAKSSSSVPSSASAKKLEGNHSWPFSFPFPAQADISARGGKQSYLTPQTFLEHGKNISVQYELVLKVSHGFLRADSKLPVNVTYIPDSVPPPLPAIRQHAYRDRIAAPGPEIDPDGWYTLSSSTIRGQLLRRTVELTCVLSLAKPLVYTRGTFIPIHFVLGSNDIQAIDVLSSPKAAQVRLVQTVEYFQDAKSLLGGTEEVEVITQAQWWVPEDPSAQNAGKRTLFGELHLPEDMQPSCSFLLLNVKYTVELIPFVSPVFEPGQRPDIPVLTCPVKIVTVHATGPIPKAVTTPKAP